MSIEETEALGKETSVRRINSVIILLFVNSFVWSQSWYVAPAGASGSPESSRSTSFRPLAEGDNLDDWLLDSQGWYWIRTEVGLKESPEGMLFEGTELAWNAWWNNVDLGASGSPPPLWGPSFPAPHIADISGTQGYSGELLMKVYLRKGITTAPPLPITGDLAELRTKQVYRTLMEYGIPAVVFILGLLLFFGSLSGGIARRDTWILNISMFGFFAAIYHLGTVLSVIPNIGAVLPWTVPIIASRIAAPFAVSFWRRSISAAGKKDPAVISLIDFIPTAFISIWGVLNLIPPSTLPKFAYSILNIDPMPWFLVWSATIGLVLWFAKTIGRCPNRLSPLILWLTSLAVPAVFFTLGSSLTELPDIFMDLGLSVSIAAAIPIAISSVKLERNISHFDILEPQEEEPEELELLEDIDNVEIELKTVPTAAPKVHKDDRLLDSIRSGLYPESIPWDMDWDLASARQGSAHPSTGFHEIYSAPGGNLSGFSFMDTGSSDLESMLFAHIARSEILRLHQPGTPLPRIARRVHRKSSAAAIAAGSTMMGVIGRFQNDSLSFLPLSVPPLLLRRNSTGKIVTLQPFEGRAANPALGSPKFGEKGLRTVNVSMFSGDVIIIYTPTLLRAASPGGQLWNIRGLAEALKTSNGMKAEEIVADIIGSLKDFIAKDRLDFPLQILVIRKR